MRVLLALSSYKGVMTAREATEIVARGLGHAGIEIVRLPAADGGSGTVDAVLGRPDWVEKTATVAGPLGGQVTARWAFSPVVATAVIEMAQAAGLALLPDDRRDPMQASTYGVGELIRAAVEAGAQKIIVGLGDSATVDGGIGMCQALGARVLDSTGRAVPPGGRGLTRVAALDLAGLLPACRDGQVQVVAACDVDNPLLGANGAARVFGPQKGATPEEVRVLEEGLGRWARVIKAATGRDVAGLPGAGAAGGLGAALAGVLGAVLQPGAATVMQLAGFDEALRGCDLVITGEGRVDAQTMHGKAPLAVTRWAQVHGVPVVILGGQLGPGAEEMTAAGALVVLAGPPPWLAGGEEFPRRAREWLYEAARRLGTVLMSRDGTREKAGGKDQ